MCSNDVYKQLNQSSYYVDLYFVRTDFLFDLLSEQQQKFILMNNLLSFFSRSAFYQSQNQGLIKMLMIYNSDSTSVLTRIPSEYLNITDSSYQTCKGLGFLEPYDPRCRPWYIYAQQHQGYFFYEPYRDAVKKSLIMTLSSQIKDGSNFQSVNSIDFDMSDILKLFVDSQNQYSVTFHEFNNTIFRHPQLNGNSVLSWEDLEFKNIQQNCVTNDEQQSCYQEKQEFQRQLTNTIKFIKSGNYSIYQQNNLDQLFQSWSKFGVKQLSLVFPLISQITKYKTQQPYSYSIILSGRVLEDKSEQFHLFNLININWIKIPLFIEFIAVSIIIAFFILNYGYFQVIQVQKPIEILIQFLKVSLKQQRQTQIQKHSKKVEKFSLAVNDSKILNLKRKQSVFLKNVVKLKNDDLFSPSSIDCSKQISRNPFFKNKSYLMSAEKFNQESKFAQIFSKDNLLQQCDIEEDGVDFSQKFDSFRDKRKTILSSQLNAKIILTTSKILSQQNQGEDDNCTKYNCQKATQTIISSNHSLKKSYFLEEKKQNNKILDGLDPLFLEMKIIKETFQNLESLITYQIDAQTQNSEDIMNGLFHFARAKMTFQKLQNQNGLDRSYFNLGIIYLLKNDYDLASEYFLSSIQTNLNAFGIDYQQLQVKNYAFPQYFKKKQLTQLKKQILCQSFCLKQQVLEQFLFELKFLLNQNHQKQCAKNILSIHNKNIQKQSSILKKVMDNFKILESLLKLPNSNKSEIFELFFYTEIIEVLILLNYINHNKQIQQYFQKAFLIVNKFQNTYSRDKFKYQHFNVKKFDNQDSIIIEEELSNSSFNDQQDIYQEKKFMIFEICKSKLAFLQGQIEYFRENYFSAIDFFTESVELGYFFCPFQRQRVIHLLIISFQNISIKQNLINQFKINFSPHLEIILLVQLDSVLQNLNLDRFLENIKPPNFLTKNDRIKVILFDKKLKTVIPLTKVETPHHFKLIIESFKHKAFQIQQNYNKKQPNLDWQQALKQSVNNIFNLNLHQLCSLKRHIKNHQNCMKFPKQNYFNKELKRNLKKLENKKQVVILFSKQSDDYSNYVLLNQQFKKGIIQEFQKIPVYHMIDQINLDKSVKQFTNENFSYEQVFFDKQIIEKLNQLRKEEQLNSSKEFIIVLNNL